MKAAATCVVLLLGVTPGAAAQERYLHQVRLQLTSSATALRDIGFDPVAEPLTGRLANGAIDTRVVTLTAGQHYALVGVCDDDCSDLDLRAFARDTNAIATDVDTDDRPVLEFTATVTGPHRVQVLMAACATSPCYWGVQLFRKVR